MARKDAADQTGSSGNTGSFRLLSRQLARELTDLEINEVAGGTRSRTRVSAQQSIIVTDDDDA